MKNLLTKIQYNNFEPGEFVEERVRSWDEVKRLIETFPWQLQKERFSVSLTNPSITLENNFGEFLKLAPYYNKKYVLYLYDGEDLYQKSYATYIDAYEDIKIFMAEELELKSIFKKEPTPFIKLNVHFLTDTFVYELSDERALKLLLYKCWISLLFLTPTILALSRFFETKKIWLSLLKASPLLLLFLLPIILYINYYRFSKKRILRISKGNQYFYYGYHGEEIKYAKSDISEIYEFPRSKYGPLFEYIRICFKTGEEIIIPDFIINPIDLIQKFRSEYPVLKKKKGSSFLPWE